MVKNRLEFLARNFFLFIVLIFFNEGNAQLANWTPASGTIFPTNLVGQINGMTRISQMKFHATNVNKFYAVTGEGGLFLTNNQATSWTVAPGTETLTSACAAVCVDYTNDQTIWLGTGDANYYSNGVGLMKSTNGGTSFSASTLTNCLVIEILQNPTNSSEFISATNKGIYKSTNGGTTWSATTATNLPFCDMISNAATNSQTVYACTKENAPKFYRSTDFGTSWTQITAGIVSSNSFVTSGARIAVTPANTNVVYFEVIGGGGIIHKSNNGGLNFYVKKPEGAPYITFYDNLSTSSTQGNYNNAITVDRADPAKLWLQSHNTWFSADSGATWTMLTFWAFDVHTDMHQVMQAPFDNTKLYSCNDGGVWLSTDGGNNWTPKTDGIYAFEIGNETGVSSLTKKDYVSIGTQDNARLYGNANGWFTINGGDDYAKRQFDYNGHIYFDGTSRQLNHTGPSSTYNLPTTNWNAFGFNHTNANLGFMGQNEVYRTTNLTASAPTWTQISTINQTIRAVHSCIADPNRLYVLVSSGDIYACNNALSTSPSFTFMNLPGSASSLGSIATMANNADIIYVSSNNSVYRSSDGGLNWTNVTYNLPNVNHRRILAEEYGGAQELVFIATNNAIYYKKAGQTSWTNYSTNLPTRRSPTGFSMFDNGTTQARIRYASFGRAMWESAFDNLRDLSAQIIVNNDTSITCASPSVQFMDGSVGLNNGPITYTWSFPGGTPATSNATLVNVSYSVTGVYSISLSIKDAMNTVSTKTITRLIQVINCNADTLPGNAISVQGTGNYATTPPIALGNTNSITLSAWIKIESNQSSFAGIIFSANGTATGLNFRNSNQIGYHYNGLASTYNYAGGPTIPLSLWTHVALVTTANNSIIYVNGVPYTNNVANAAISFTNGFNIGNDRNNTARTMDGLIEEVCFYDRALSQNEIRELMHLTKNHNVIDAGLKTYYQCNEVGGIIFDRAGSANATLQGTSTHQLSTAPLGSGNSERMTITTSGQKIFPNEGMIMTFPGSTLPNGEICVTRLNIQPDSLPPFITANNGAAKYWIINNYGTNAGFNALNNFSLTGYGTILSNESLAPFKFKLHSRATGEYLASSWNLIDSAYAATSGTNGSVTYSASVISNFNKQFTVIKRTCLAPTSPTIVAGANPVCLNASSTLSLSGAVLNDASNWFWYKTSCGTPSNLIGSGVSIVVSPTTTTTYYARGEGGCAIAGLCSSITMSISTIPASAGIISGSTLVCAGAYNVYSLAPVAGASGYVWSLPSNWQGSSGLNNILVNAGLSAGVISVAPSNSCGAAAGSSIAVNVKPSYNISQSHTLCPGETLSVGSSTYFAAGTYTNLLQTYLACDSLVTTSISLSPLVDVNVTVNEETLSANQNDATYQWIDCDTGNSTITGATSQSFTPTTNGNYAVIVTYNNCSDTSACKSIMTTALSKNNLQQSIKIYPNPVTGKVTIECGNCSESLKLLNSIGQEVMEITLKSAKEIVDLSALNKGVYFLVYSQQKLRIVTKVVVQ
jgi:hypothetical protein